jgi:TRAP-type C4-dicarboxylate transport system permease small subunit
LAAERAAAADARGIGALAAMQRFRAGYGRALEWLVGALMVVLFVEVTVGVLFRMTGRSLIWYDEVASVLLAWLTFYGSALASVRRAHIGCPELVERAPWPLRRAVSIVAQVLVIAFFAVLGVTGVWIMPILAGDTLVSVPVPMNLVQSVIPVSALLIIVAEVTYLVDLVVAVRPPAAGGDGIALADGLH